MHRGVLISKNLKISENQARNIITTDFSKTLLNPYHESKALTCKQPLRVSNQGQICNHQHSSEQTTPNKKQQTRQRQTSNPTESQTKSTTVTES